MNKPEVFFRFPHTCSTPEHTFKKKCTQKITILGELPRIYNRIPQLDFHTDSWKCQTISETFTFGLSPRHDLPLAPCSLIGNLNGPSGKWIHVFLIWAYLPHQNMVGMNHLMFKLLKSYFPSQGKRLFPMAYTSKEETVYSLWGYGKVPKRNVFSLLASIKSPPNIASISLFRFWLAKLNHNTQPSKQDMFLSRKLESCSQRVQHFLSHLLLSLTLNPFLCHKTDFSP